MCIDIVVIHLGFQKNLYGLDKMVAIFVFCFPQKLALQECNGSRSLAKKPTIHLVTTMLATFN